MSPGEGFLVLVTLDGKVVDWERFAEREEADLFRAQTIHEIEQLMDMGDPGTWEVLLSEVGESDLFVPREAGKLEKAPELAEQFQKMSASYKETERMRLYYDRKYQIMQYLEARKKDAQRMQPKP